MGLSGLRIWVVTAVYWITAVLWVRSLAWELPYANTVAKKKKKKKKREHLDRPPEIHILYTPLPAAAPEPWDLHQEKMRTGMGHHFCDWVAQGNDLCFLSRSYLWLGFDELSCRIRKGPMMRN